MPESPVTGRLTILVALFALFATVAGSYGGPALGDHEALVASCARKMRTSGDWITPQFLETPFIRKSPLPFWTVAAASYLFDDDPGTKLPVTTAAARLPNALLGFLTVICLWVLASSMFSRRAGLVTAVVSASSVALLLYAPNATAEMPLTFGCAWAFMHFWLGIHAKTTRANFVHMMLFYFALGVGMLGKGPQPIIMVGFPLAIWWYAQRPLRILAGGGHNTLKRALAAFVRDLKPKTGEVFTRLWLFPGIILFALTFVPWMLAVAARNDHAWQIWNWQYLQRIEGDFPDTRHRGILYYLPIVGGLVIPWTFLVIEASIAPWIQRYARWRKGLGYAGLWVLVGATAMSLMEFKKPYYVLAAAPGLLLLIGAVADWFFARAARGARIPGTIWIGIVTQAVAMIGGGYYWLRKEGVVSNSYAMLIVLLIAGAFALAGYLYKRGRGWWALVVPAAGMVVAFHLVWFAFGPSIDNVDKVALLAKNLDKAGLPKDADLQWVDSRPDARLGFYFDRRSRHMIEPEEIVARMVDRKAGRRELELFAIDRAKALLTGPDPVYLIIQRRNYDRVGTTMPPATRVLTVASVPTESVEKDWVVVTNRPADK